MTKLNNHGFISYSIFSLSTFNAKCFAGSFRWKWGKSVWVEFQMMKSATFCKLLVSEAFNFKCYIVPEIWNWLSVFGDENQRYSFYGRSMWKKCGRISGNRFGGWFFCNHFLVFLWYCYMVFGRLFGRFNSSRGTPVFLVLTRNVYNEFFRKKV